MNHYYKRPWGELAGDPIPDLWGTSIYYLETDAEGWPTRQIQVFQNGKRLKYDAITPDDDYGGLGDQVIDAEEFSPFLIDGKEFEIEWLLD